MIYDYERITMLHEWITTTNEKCYPTRGADEGTLSSSTSTPGIAAANLDLWEGQEGWAWLGSSGVFP